MSKPGKEVVITGAGVVSPLGETPSALHRALADGRSGLKPATRFDTSGLRARQAGEITDFDPRAHLTGGNYRPLDRTAQLVTAAARLALAASGWTREQRAAHEVGLVLGTMFCSVHTISAFDVRAQTAGPSYAKPLDFANSVINAAAGQTAIWHDLRGVNSTVAGGTTAGVQALIYAAEQIRIGRAAALLAGGGEELCFESFYGFYQSGHLGGSTNGTLPCSVPFDARRNGFTLGEGAALLMLEDAETASARGATVLGRLLGHASGFDLSRGEDPASAVATVARTVRLALDDAGLDAAAIDAVSASANGSVAGDRHEALGLAAAFGERAASLPVTAVKSMLGESLGAGGALQTLALMEAMGHGELPGINGLHELEEGVALAGAQGARRALEMRRGLVTSVGLDGNVNALVIERS